MNNSIKRRRFGILFRHPVFYTVFLLGLCLIVFGVGRQFFSSMVGLSHSIQPKGPSPDVSQLDLITVFESAKIVLRYIVQGGSLFDPGFVSQQHWSSSFIKWGLILLVSGMCLLVVILARERIAALATFVGSLVITGMALVTAISALIVPHGGAEFLRMIFMIAVGYIVVGAYGLIVATKELGK